MLMFVPMLALSFVCFGHHAGAAAQVRSAGAGLDSYPVMFTPNSRAALGEAVPGRRPGESVTCGLPAICRPLGSIQQTLC